jgi:3'(2'), 5'-bisphosphate nucleotidase
LQRLCGIAQAAGQEIMAVYEQGGATWQRADTSPLTEADLWADQVIRQGLEAAFPGVYILSDESRCQQGMLENPALR